MSTVQDFKLFPHQHLNFEIQILFKKNFGASPTKIRSVPRSHDLNVRQEIAYNHMMEQEACSQIDTTLDILGVTILFLYTNLNSYWLQYVCNISKCGIYSLILHSINENLKIGIVPKYTLFRYVINLKTARCAIST